MAAKRPAREKIEELGPVDLPDPDMVTEVEDDARSPFADIPWLRGLQSLFFLAATYVAMWVLGIATVIQWFWMAIAKEKNPQIAEFGKGLSAFLRDVALFQSGESDEKPFPWKKWGA